MVDLCGQSIGRYHVVERLGEGGMATVYKAYDTRLERDVALKVIRMEAFSPMMVKHMLRRFEREAKALARLSHPNIVNIFDYGEYQGAPYLVMAFIPAGTLKALIGKPLPSETAASMLAPIAHALEYAHSEGLVHRDVKPANILITKSGQAVLSDFGIAKIVEGGESTHLTSTGVGVGTPEYMAPEQWENRILPQTDIYALGVIFYELVTGRKPYTADTPAAVLIKQASQPLPRPRDFIPDLPEEVEKVLFKALAKSPEDRYQSMGEFAAVLDGLSRRIEAPGETLPISTITGPLEILTIPLPAPPEKSFASVKETETFDPASLLISTTRRSKFPIWGWVLGTGGFVVVLLVIVLLASGLGGGTLWGTRSLSGGLTAVPVSEIPTEKISESTPRPPVQARLEIYHLWADPVMRASVDALFKVFSDTYPGVEIIENTGVNDTISPRMAVDERIANGNPPDITQLRGGRVELKTYVDNNRLIPLDDLYAGTGYEDVLTRQAFNVVSVDGHPYGVPVNLQIQNLLFYNKPMLDEMGLLPPKNTAELLDVCRVIKNQKAIPCLSLGGVDDWAMVFLFDSILLEMAGPENYVRFHKGEMSDAEHEILLRESLGWMNEILPYITPGFGEMDWLSSCERVVSGKAAMVVMGSWAIPYCFEPAGWKAGSDYNAVIFPLPPQPALLFHPDSFGMLRKAPHPDMAMGWLNVLTGRDLQVDFVTKKGGLFARRDIGEGFFSDSIRQKLQIYANHYPDMLILDQFGGIMPAHIQEKYWIVIANFLDNRDIEGTTSAVIELFKSEHLIDYTAWYVWQ